MIIYVLVDPRNKLKVRYVGKTNRKLSTRLAEHLCHTKNGYNKYYSGCWIKSLIKENLKPLIFPVEKCSELDWEEREKYWIKFYKENGHPITNIEEGGLSNAFIPVKLRKERKGKTIYMYKDNKFIKKFDKVVEAAKYVNGNRGVIAACARWDSFLAYGYQWAYKRNGFKPKEKRQAYKVFLMQYHNKEKIFYSTKEAMDYTGLSGSSINKCLREENYTVFSYNFSHLKKGVQ